MRNFDFYSPTYFVFGKDREAETGRYVKRFGGSRVLVVYGGQSAKRSGLLDRIMACLKEENLYAVELGGVKPNPRSGLVYEGIDLCRREKIDFILAVGGGSVIDTAKAIAIGVPYDGDFWDFFSGKVPEQALPVGTVLTIAASGSEGSPDSIITNEKTLEKNGAEADCLRPCFSVLDPALTESLPAYQTACGITDIMAHTFERYFTNTPDVEVTDRMLEGVLLAMLHEGRRVMEDPHNYEARANIMWAGMVCHNDIMGVGRQQDWNSHHLEHVLSAKYDCAHGAGLAVIMPAWMHYCAEHGGEKRLAQMAVRVFGCQMDFDDPKRTALEGIEAFRAFLRSIGMPLTFAEIGADPADADALADYLASCDEGELLRLLGDQYQAGNPEGLPLRHDGASFYYEGMQSAAQNFGSIDPAAMAPDGYRIPGYDDYAFFAGSRNYNLGGVGTRSYRNMADDELTVRILEREATLLGQRYGTMALYEFRSGGACWVLCGLGHQWNTTAGNISPMMLLLATAGDGTNSWVLEGYAQADRPGQNWLKFVGQNSTKTRMIRCVKTPVEYMYD